MMRPTVVLAVTRAEMRTTLRLIYYWLFALVTIGVGCMVYVELARVHGIYSGTAAGLGTFSPQFYVGLFGVYFYLLLFVGLVFFAFDIRSRDERERMAEVLDSRPHSDAEYLLGKFCALVALAWLPVLLLMVLIEGAGHLALVNDFPYGVPPEPWSLVGFLLYALAGLALWCAFIMWMTTVFGNRLVVAAISLAVIAVQYWTGRNLPFYLTTVLSMSPGIDYASEITPRLFRPGEIIRLVAFATLAMAFLAFAARSYPRKDGRRPRVATATGLVLAAFGFVAMMGYYLHQTQPHRQLEVWLAAHEAKSHLPRTGPAVPQWNAVDRTGGRSSVLARPRGGPSNGTIAVYLEPGHAGGAGLGGWEASELDARVRFAGDDPDRCGASALDPDRGQRFAPRVVRLSGRLPSTHPWRRA